MKLLAFVVVVVVAAGSARAQVEQCPSYDTLDRTVYLPHPYDCSLFRRCQAGTAVLGHCPPGRQFSPSSRACEEPSLANCTAAPNTCASKKPQFACRYQCVCSREGQNLVCPSSLQFGAELNVVHLAAHPGCEKDTRSFVLRGGNLGTLVTRNATATVSMCDPSLAGMDVPHYADCTKGVRCEDGKEKPLKCKDGLYYDSLMGYCDDPEYVNCTLPSEPPAATGCSQDAAISTCRHGCSCEVVVGSCPARLRFTTTTSIFNAMKQPACLKEPVVIALGDQFVATLAIHPNTTIISHCPSSRQASPLFIPDPNRCGVATLCQNGRERQIQCPNDLSFDPQKKKCVKADPAVCQDVVPPTALPPPPPVAVDNASCAVAVPCPAGANSRVAHLTDCSLFCLCTQGTAALGACPPGLHFNAQMQMCDQPDKANCKTRCLPLPASNGGSWSPSECVTSQRQEGADCRLTCDSSHQLVGSETVRCTKKGWHGTGGLNVIPSCNTAQEVAVKIVDKINETLTQLNQSKEDASLLFVFDESGSISTSNFQLEKDFAAELVSAFPLSRNRSAGVITFSDTAATDIPLTETNTCSFLSRLKSIKYSSGGTDIALALRIALRDVNAYSAKKSTLVFLVTDGQSSTDPTAAAQALRSKDRSLFTIGVGGYDRKQLEPISSTYRDGSKLFFGLPNFAVFKVVAEYLRTTYKQGAANICP